jgi:hypothetical protein
VREIQMWTLDAGRDSIQERGLVMRVLHPFDIGDRNQWSALMLTEMAAAMALFLGVIAGLWFILGTLG